MKNAYPIILNRGENFFVVDIPDFHIGTQGESIADAMEMARDAIGIVGLTLEDEGKPLPTPSVLSEVSGGELVTLVDVDFEEYRRRNENRTVRKNVTIPSWLNEEAEKAGINFSSVLTAALKSTLNTTRS